MEVRTGYMDKVDFEHELGEALGGNKVYSSLEDLRRQKPCTDSCGIVRVEVRAVEVVQETNFTRELNSPEAVAMNAALKEHRRTGRPIPQWVMPGQFWANLETLSVYEIGTVVGETVYWKDGERPVQIRDLSEHPWARVGQPKKRKV